jgi:hypothetical protein
MNSSALVLERMASFVEQTWQVVGPADRNEGMRMLILFLICVISYIARQVVNYVELRAMRHGRLLRQED